MKIVYISGKYTGTPSETLKYIEDAEIASVELMRLGWGTLTPHKNAGSYEKYEAANPNLTYDWFISMDLEMLRRCDAIFMLSNWTDSKGAKIELKFAKEMGIPVYYESEGFPTP